MLLVPGQIAHCLLILSRVYARVRTYTHLSPGSRSDAKLRIPRPLSLLKGLLAHGNRDQGDIARAPHHSTIMSTIFMQLHGIEAQRARREVSMFLFWAMQVWLPQNVRRSVNGSLNGPILSQRLLRVRVLAYKLGH